MGRFELEPKWIQDGILILMMIIQALRNSTHTSDTLLGGNSFSPRIVGIRETHPPNHLGTIARGDCYRHTTALCFETTSG